MNGLLAVTARIGEIQGHLEALAAGPAAAARAGSGAGGAAFGAVLSTALEDGASAATIGQVLSGAGDQDGGGSVLDLLTQARPAALAGLTGSGLTAGLVTSGPAGTGPSGAGAGVGAATTVDGTGGLPGITAAVARFSDLFAAATTRHGLPAGLLAAVAQVESAGDPDAVSRAGARGLMQIMPGTARDLGVDATVPAQAVDGAARLLASHLERFGSLDLALAAYNAGPGNVRKYGGVPPFTETQNYVRKVNALLDGGTGR